MIEISGRCQHRSKLNPFLSIVVVLYNMRREAERSLRSLSASYQRGVNEYEYEIHVVENGSDDPVDEAFVKKFGCNFHYHRIENAPKSPARALNHGVSRSRGDLVALMIDGAHILTPGILNHVRRICRVFPNPVVATRRFFLGPGQQPETILEGYDQCVEDELLKRINWPDEPYRLFEVAAHMGVQHKGWMGTPFESNCLVLSRQTFQAIGGCDERFDYPGGGFLNLDLFDQAAKSPGTQVVALLGEGSFHQVHGGTTTNSDRAESERLIERYEQQFELIRGSRHQVPQVKVTYFGALNDYAFIP